jgi:hypothetical protein
MEPLAAGERVLAFVRAHGGEKWFVVLNFGRDEAALPGTFEKVLFGAASIEESGIRVPAMRYAVVR